MYPFKWRRVYIPVLARELLEYTDAPTPFIMGIHSSFLSQLPQLKEVVLVGLDHNSVTITETLPDFPSQIKNKLIEALLDHVHPSIAHIDFAFESGKCVFLTNMYLGFELNFFSILFLTQAEDHKSWDYHEKQIRAAFLAFFVDLFSGYNHHENPAEEEAKFLQTQSPQAKVWCP
jgi:hypothetical protein